MSALAGAKKWASAPKYPQQGGRQVRFLAQHIVLEEIGIPGFLRTMIIVVGVIIMTFLVWAATTDVREVAVAPGEVIPTGQVQIVQHLEGGIIDEILTEDGAVVDAGQILLRLDPKSVVSKLGELRANRAGLLLKAERLRAFSEGRTPDFSFVDSKYTGLAADQLAIFEVQESARVDREAVLDDQIKKNEAQLDLLEGQKKTHSKVIALLNEELGMRQTLLKKGLSSKLKVLDMQRQAAKAQGEYAELLGEVELAKRTLAESRSRRQELDATLREEAISELDTLTRELAEVGETLVRLEDQADRLDIRAPVAGIVKGLQMNTLGGVVSPGGVVLEIVPMDKEMFVEAHISTRDVGHVEEGQPVTVKVSTYDYARYGGVSGKLAGVSASTFVNDQGIPYYKGFVSLDHNYVGGDPKRNLVLPGMTVQADIKTGSKTLLQYLLKPVYASVNESFRER